MREIFREIVGAVILSSDDYIVMGRKDPKSGGVYADCWQIPGGGIESGETALQALEREVAQECAVSIADGKVSLLDDRGAGSAPKRLSSGEEVLCRMKFLIYLVETARPASGLALSAGDDLIEARWVHRSQLKSLRLTPPGVEMFLRLGWLEKCN